MSILNEWFDRRGGLAYGIQFGANGLSGLGLPSLVKKLFHRYGFTTTLRCYAVGFALITLPALFSFALAFHIPPRPKPPRSKSPRYTLKTFQFWYFATRNLLQRIAFSVPSKFLPTFAYSLFFPSSTGPLLLAIFNLFQAFSDPRMAA